MTVNKYECDGCHKVIEVTEEEMMTMDCDCPEFWGWMQVGGQAWFDYHDKGEKPMGQLSADLKEAYESFMRKN
jgi:hypothetical protein